MKKSALLIAVSAISFSVIAAAPAVAQSTPTANDEAATEIDEEDSVAEDNGSIVVTGSRIRRDTFNSADPVNVITRDEATQAGFTSTAEVLQSIAVTNGTAQINNSFGGFVTAGGPGANTISLRGAGTTRTLTVLNGRRVAPAGSRGSVGAADLNVLPNAMIDRIEVLNGGASSIYGSDAIAGVINIVTRDKIEGLSLEALHSVPQIGDGFERRYSAVFGTNADRLELAGSLEYFKRDRVVYGDVDFTACQTQLIRNSATGTFGEADFIDPATGQSKCYGIRGGTGNSGVTINTIATPNLAGGTVARAPGVPAGYTGTCNRFRPRVGATGAAPGYECVGGGTLDLNIRDTFSPFLLEQDLVSPTEIFTAFGKASYDITDSMEIYGEFLFNRRKSNQDQQRQFTLDYPFLSPLIPTALRFPTAALPAQATNPGVPVGIRVFADYGIYNNRQEVDFTRTLAGVTGSFLEDWRYDAYVMKSWADSSYTSDLILTDRLNQSLDVVASGAGFACRVATRNCVAAPQLTNDVIGGRFPADWFNFVVQPVTGRTQFVETIASASVDGPLFKLPGGDAQVAIGVEYRKSRIDDTPSPESQVGNVYNFSSSSITRGSDAVKEIFGEIDLPLLADMPFAHRLTITGSARYTDYDSFGSEVTYKVGGVYAPVEWLSFRGNYGTSYRAPALFEQFLGSTSGFQASTLDPCNNLSPTNTAPVRYANCRSEGLADGFNATTSVRVNQRGGAESGLGAETSKNLSAGVVFQPKLGSFGNFSFAVDYFDILIENGVSQLGAGTILAQCYDDQDFRSASICALAQRESGGQRSLTVTTGFVNISNVSVEGWDITARYTVPIGKGTFRLNAAVTKFDERYFQTLPTDRVFNVIGTVNNPEWTGSFNASYRVDNWNFRYGVDWIQGTNTDADFLGLTQAARDQFDFTVPDYFLHGASVQYSTDSFGITLGVNNLFDKEPPQISGGAYNRIGNAPLYSGYDYVGRTFFLNVSKKF
jgi:iron complex outermembrane recepter protein